MKDCWIKENTRSGSLPVAGTCISSLPRGGGSAAASKSSMLDSPEESTTYTFQCATNIPCPGTPTVEYEGQVYNTIQIFSQCWLKENLNVGTMIQGIENMADNDTIEKYCYGNEPDSCAKYGGLYQWDEMMQYTTQQGARGICPPGWHLPPMRNGKCWKERWTASMVLVIIHGMIGDIAVMMPGRT